MEKMGERIGTLGTFFVLLVMFILVRASTENCPSDCQCSGDEMMCTRSPSFVRTGVRRVRIAVNEDGAFVKPTGDGWGEVVYLKLSAIRVPYIANDTFEELGSLEYLGMNTEYIRSFQKGALNGLGNLKILDLSNCLRLSSFYVLEILKNKSTAPLLQKLILNKLNIYRYPPLQRIPLDKEFTTALLPRNVTEISLQNDEIGKIDLQALLPLCSSVETLDLTSVSVEGKFFKSFQHCKSIRTLIVNDIQYKSKKAKQEIHNSHVEFDTTGLNFIRSLKRLEAKRYFIGDSRYLCYNCTLNITNLTGKVSSLALTELHIDENNLNYIDWKIVGIQAFSHLIFLSARKNSMEYLSPEFFRIAPLKKLDLSINELWKMQTGNTSMFAKLVSYLPLLEELNLSQNNLSVLPVTMFDSNPVLKILKLTGNILTQIYFSRSPPISLLDITENKIQILDEQSKAWIENCNKVTGTLHVNVTQNPFVCSCSSFDFFKWMLDSTFIFAGNKNSLQCDFEGTSRLITEANIHKIKADICYKAKTWFIVILTIGSIFVATLIALISWKTIKKMRHHREKRQNREENMNLLREFEDDLLGGFEDGLLGGFEDFAKFKTFLSFSSRDADLVMTHIYPILDREFRRVTNVDADTILVGDLHFRPGRSFHNEMIRYVKLSNVFLAVVSDNYCNSPFCRTEMEIASSNEKPIIMMLLGEVDTSKMSPVMKNIFDKYTRVKIYIRNGRVEIEPSWRSLVDAILEMPTRRMERNNAGNADDVELLNID